MRPFIAANFLVIVLGFFTFAHAETLLTCPSVESVRQGTIFSWWLPLYVSNDELASKADAKKFSEAVTRFARTEWSGDFLEAGHCFYEGDDPIMKQIMLARDMLKPESSESSQWEFITPKKLACFMSNEDECPYGGIGRIN
jgi:hypothetical protein